MKKLIFFGVAFYIHAILMFYKGIERIEEYYMSEDFDSLNKYAYVGGDAYNYIINSNIQNSYIVVGTGSLIIGSIFFVTISIVNAINKTNKQKVEEMNN